MKVITYEELMRKPSGTVCSQYCGGVTRGTFELSGMFVISDKFGEGDSYIKYLTPYIKDGIFYGWHYKATNHFDIAEEYGKGLYVVLSESDIKNIMRELVEW